MPHLDWWGQLPLFHFLLYLVSVFQLIRQHGLAKRLEVQYAPIPGNGHGELRQDPFLPGGGRHPSTHLLDRR